MEVREQLSMGWRASRNACRDEFKAAVHGALLGFVSHYLLILLSQLMATVKDAPKVNTTIEDWLWARLLACKSHPQGSESTFWQLQSNVSLECGEQYFVNGPGGNNLLYFSALVLTGQLERAIQALIRADLLSHAAHVAIHCYQMKLLVLADDPNDEICKSNQGGWYELSDDGVEI